LIRTKIEINAFTFIWKTKRKLTGRPYKADLILILFLTP
jgi:hypothetical protein